MENIYFAEQSEWNEHYLERDKQKSRTTSPVKEASCESYCEKNVRETKMRDEITGL